MYKTLLILILLFVLIPFSFSQNLYEDFIPSKTILSDDFKRDDNKWSTTSDSCYKKAIGNNVLEISSTCTDFHPIFSLTKDMDMLKDFELEAEIQFVHGEDDNALSLMWGKEEGTSNRCIFAISGNGHYMIAQFSGTWNNIKEWTFSDIVRKTDFNKLTVRKIKNQYYFFLNEQLVASSPFYAFTGRQTGFQVNQNTTMRVRNFNASYLKPLKPEVAETSNNNNKILLKEKRWGGSISPLMGYMHSVGETGNRWKGGWNIIDGFVGYRFLPNMGIEAGVNVAYIKMDESNQVSVTVTDGYNDWDEKIDKAVYISCPLGLKVTFPVSRSGKNFLTIGGGGSYVHKANSTNIGGFEPFRSNGFGYYARIAYFIKAGSGNNEGMDFQIRYITDYYEGVWSPPSTHVMDGMLLFTIDVAIL